MRRLGGIAALAVAATLLGGCTHSYDPQNSLFSSSGATTVRPSGAGLELVTSAEVSSLTAAFTAATEIPVAVVAQSTGADDEVVWDSSDAEATPVGREFWCVVANQSWFTVNRVDLPAVTADLTKKEWAPLLAIEPPEQSAASRLWLASLKDSGAFLEAAQKEGA